MPQGFRQAEILEIAARDGKVTVEGLAAHFSVTLQTIRRDLSELDQAGLLNRVHGGAMPASGTSNFAYEDRRALQTEAKDQIARACAAAIPDDCSVFLNIGTSTEAVAGRLTRHQNLLVITNNLNVANILSRAPGVEIYVTGGTLRRADGGLIGPLAIDAINNFKFDYAVIGCSALDLDGDVLDFDVQEVGVSQAIVARARKTYLVADHSKFERTAPARICSLAQIDGFFTDRALDPDLAARCEAWQVTVSVSDG
ncbi:DeoR/GlpR family DNA-binding transcription regulator [Jannaschia sp. CCS1]|uniref:DeoR/GlpR family DNA-binding transcription regulator n=1 Tax=Jannaschia sp. (strain CCS1) TaxID=290400 RepID=UPI000053D275|nr:DeoR/GlpR family DNA-binding transcription regulator [Jannaschia sp. CCS1]ABD54988.1 transcriptional regulator, DeoR family [Jannaschia sp. CCS1]